MFCNGKTFKWESQAATMQLIGEAFADLTWTLTVASRHDILINVVDCSLKVDFIEHI